MASWLKYHIVFEGEWGSLENLGEPKKLYQNWEKGLGICFYFFDFLYFWEIWQIIDFCYQVKIHRNLHCITTTRAKQPMGVVFIGGGDFNIYFKWNLIHAIRAVGSLWMEIRTRRKRLRAHTDTHKNDVVGKKIQLGHLYPTWIIIPYIGISIRQGIIRAMEDQSCGIT